MSPKYDALVELFLPKSPRKFDVPTPIPTSPIWATALHDIKLNTARIATNLFMISLVFQ